MKIFENQRGDYDLSCDDISFSDLYDTVSNDSKLIKKKEGLCTKMYN